MSELSNKSVVSKDNYYELKNMMLSDDLASVTLAVTILEQSDYELSEIYIISLIKDTFSKVFKKTDAFKEQCPELYENVANSVYVDGADLTVLSSKHIYNTALKKGNQEELEFVLNLLTKDLTELLSTMGYGFVDYTDVLIKPKGWEKANNEKLKQLELVNG
jgi:hypothetical protein